jgi:hypothetical protein
MLKVPDPRAKTARELLFFLRHGLLGRRNAFLYEKLSIFLFNLNKLAIQRETRSSFFLLLLFIPLSFFELRLAL